MSSRGRRRSPLARKLFSIDNVTGIFVASDFVGARADDAFAIALEGDVASNPPKASRTGFVSPSSVDASRWRRGGVAMAASRWRRRGGGGIAAASRQRRRDGGATAGRRRLELSTPQVTVSKDEEGAWATIKPHVFSHIMDFFAEGSDAIASGDAVASDTEILDTDSEVVAMIKELIEVRIRPAVQEDGGDIFFRGFDDATGIVSVELAGSCVGCPSSSVTLNNGVENMLMHYVEEVKGIENVTPEEEADEFKLSFAPQDSHLSI